MASKISGGSVQPNKMTFPYGTTEARLNFRLCTQESSHSVHAAYTVRLIVKLRDKICLLSNRNPDAVLSLGYDAF